MTTETTTPPTAAEVALTVLRTIRGEITSPPGSGFQGAIPDPVAVSRYLAHDFPAAVRRAEEAIADALPALTEADVVKLANGDHAVKRTIEAWRDTFSFVDVTDLGGEEGEDDKDKWELVAGGSSRFEVREVPRYEARRVGGVKMDANGNPRGEMPGWIVWDNESNEECAVDEDVIRQAMSGADPDTNPLTEQGARSVVACLNEREEASGDARRWIAVDTEDDDKDLRDVVSDFAGNGGDYDTEDESSAQEAADAANAEDYQQNANAWPFAHNYAAEIDRMYTDDFAAAGFVVVEHTPSGKLYAGIDGGGYSFTDAHWAPAFLRYRLHGKYAPEYIYITTDAGLRKVLRDGAK